MTEQKLRDIQIRLLAFEDFCDILIRVSPVTPEVAGVIIRNLDTQIGRRFPANIPDGIPGQAEKRAAYTDAIENIKDRLGTRKRVR